MTKEYWVFLAYKNEKDYPLHPFHTKVFTNFDEMKDYSGDHAFKWGEKKNPSYCSDYVKGVFA